MDIANRIKTLRVENNMTQKQLSEKLGLTPKMISFYEKGERIPPLDIGRKTCYNFFYICRLPYWIRKKSCFI